MRHLSYLVFVITLGLFSCSSQKKLETKTPFEIGSASCQQWTGGREGSGSGITLKIPVSNVTDTVEFQKAYFRGKTGEIRTNTINDQLFAMVEFVTKKANKPDIVMHSDPKKEVGNQPPKRHKEHVSDFPFELKSDEAILSYLENGDVKYVKVSTIKEKPISIYQSRPKN
ncbi:MAG: hypothetical protein AAFZ89_08700 [Bacteroidota bacterium]